MGSSPRSIVSEWLLRLPFGATEVDAMDSEASPMWGQAGLGD